MLNNVIMPLIIAGSLQAPSPAEIQAAQPVFNLVKWAAAKQVILVAGARRAPGPDHGGDPNDETHDGGLPANKEAGNGFPSSDPYNDEIPNGRKPY